MILDADVADSAGSGLGRPLRGIGGGVGEQGERGVVEGFAAGVAGQVAGEGALCGVGRPQGAAGGGVAALRGAFREECVGQAAGEAAERGQQECLHGRVETGA